MSDQWQESLIDYLADASQTALDAATLVASVAVRPTTATVQIITLTATSQVVAPFDVNRRQLILFNDSGAAIFIKFGVGATTSNFTVRLAPNSSYEIPLNGYCGDVSGVRTSGTGPLLVTTVTI
jgi:hypothetical protein